jgi:hypothetical protein
MAPEEEGTPPKDGLKIHCKRSVKVPPRADPGKTVRIRRCPKSDEHPVSGWNFRRMRVRAAAEQVRGSAAMDGRGRRRGRPRSEGMDAGARGGSERTTWK